MNLYQKLNTIQSAVRGLGKDQSQQLPNGKRGYDYVSESKVLEHIKPLMADLGLILNTEVTDMTNQRIDYLVSSGQKSAMFTRVKMRFTWIDCESGETLTSEWAGTGMNEWDKGYGSAITYGHRYYLLKFFHIATDGDDVDALTDEAHTEDSAPVPAAAPLPPAPVFDEAAYEAEKKKIYEGLNNITDPTHIRPYYLGAQKRLLTQDVDSFKTACTLRSEQLTTKTN